MAALRDNVKRCLSCASAFPAWAKGGSYGFAKFHQSSIGEDERDNVRDHRVRTEDLPFQNHAQAGLRVHRIDTHHGPSGRNDCPKQLKAVRQLQLAL